MNEASTGRPSFAWALWCLLLPWLLLFPAPVYFASHVLSGPDQEAIQHLWGLWAAWQSNHWLVVRTDRISWPTGFSFPLIDPGNVPWFAVGDTLAGPVAGFNTVLLVGVAIVGVAGALLTRAAGGDGKAQALGAVAAMACPALLSNAGEGITESFSVGWCGVALAGLLLWLSERRIGWAALSAFAIGAAVWGGPYNALWVALLCGAVGLARLREWRLTVPVGLAGALLASPAMWAQTIERVDGLPGTASRAEWVLPVLDPAVFRGGNLAGADLVDPFLPGFVTGGEAPAGHTAYLGVVALVVAVLAVRADRRRWPWLAGAGAFVVVSMGLYLSFWGKLVPVGTDGWMLAPMGFLARGLPFLLRFTRWYRAAAVAGMLLAPLVALGAGRFRALVGFLLVADACLLAPRAWPIESFDARPSPVWAAMDEPGAVVDLPPVQWSFVPEGGIRDENLLQQVWHGRANAAAFFNLSGGAANSSEITTLMKSAIGKGGEAGVAAQRLAGLGYRYVVVDRTRFQDLSEGTLEAVLGAPVVSDRHYLVYRLPDAAAPVEPDYPPWRSPVPPTSGRPGDGGPPQTGPGGFHQGGPTATSPR